MPRAAPRLNDLQFEEADALAHHATRIDLSEAARRSSGSALRCAIESSLKVATAARNRDFDVDMQARDGGMGLDHLDRYAQISVGIHGRQEWVLRPVPE